MIAKDPSSFSPVKARTVVIAFCTHVAIQPVVKSSARYGCVPLPLRTSHFKALRPLPTFSCTMATARLLGDFAVRRLGAVTAVRVGGVIATAS